MNRIGLNNGFGRAEVADCVVEQFDVISELAQSQIASIAQKASHGPCGVGMVNVEHGFRIAANATWRISADSTSSVLKLKQTGIVGESNPVVIPELASAEFEFSVLNKLIVKKFFSIWLERAFGAARLVRCAVANLNVCVHGAEVVLSSANAAWTVFPNARRLSVSTSGTAFDGVGRWFCIVLESTPMVVAKLSAFFAFVGFTARVTDGHREVGSEDFNLLAKRTNMFAIFKGRSIPATQEMFLKESLTDVCFAKTALDLFGAFHKYTVSKIAVKVNGILKSFNNSDSTLGFVCN